MFIHEAVAKAQKNNEVIYRASAKRKEQDIYALIKNLKLTMLALKINRKNRTTVNLKI